MRILHLAPLALATGLAACVTPQLDVVRYAKPSGEVLAGVDVLARDGFKLLEGKRVGLITNPTGKNKRGVSTAQLFAEALNFELVALYSPEHGITGKSEDESISSSTILLAGRRIPVHSLYGGGIMGMRPSPESLAGVDILVFDIQDIGARFYTYTATMAMAMEEAAKRGLPFVVLDRPNPIGGVEVEGPVLRDLSLRKLTPVAYFPVATRHGMTPGELAAMHHAAIGRGRLIILGVSGWNRSMWYDETALPWTPPSPNMPDLDAAALYPGIACLEFTNLSVGRGTNTPFGWIGAPWLDADALAATLQAEPIEGVEFSSEERTPTKSMYAGQKIPGLRITLTDRKGVRSLRVFAHVAVALRDLHPREFDLKWDATRKLVGSDEFKTLYDRGASAREFIRLFDDESSRFAAARAKYLLY